MKLKRISFLLIILVIYSCLDNEKVKETKHNTETITNEVKITLKDLSSIKLDSTLSPKKVDLLFTLSDKKHDTLIAFCNCEKSIKNNTLKIQLRTEFPPLSELKKGNRHTTEFQNIPKQYRFLTFYLKDSIVEGSKLLMASAEAQFGNKKIDSVSVKCHKIKINKFNYRIAQDVWGSYEVKLLSSFGFIENDTIIKGTFHCNNWKIVTFNDLLTWTYIKKEHIE